MTNSIKLGANETALRSRWDRITEALPQLASHSDLDALM